MKKKKKKRKGTSFEIARGFLSCLLSLRPWMPHICCFLDCFSFSHYFEHFLFFLEMKAMIIKFPAKICIKQVKFGSSRRIILLLPSKTIQQNWLHFFGNLKKTVCALRLDKTKVTSRNTFIDNPFEKKEKKKKKKKWGQGLLSRLRVDSCPVC